MTVFLLIRHGANDSIDQNILAGRTPDVHLNEQGRRQAADLAEFLRDRPLQAIYSSPLERTMETAEPIARLHHVEVQVLPEITEVDYGAWTGRSVADLALDPCWKAYNTLRGGTRIPSGELGLEVQLRMIRAFEKLSGVHETGLVALVSHGDPIRVVLAHCLNAPLDAVLRFDIALASVSVMEYTCGQPPRVLCINGNGQGLPL